MSTYVKPIGQEVEKKSLWARISLRNKIIGAAVLVILVLIIISIPGDRSQLIARAERVDAAQVAYDLAMPAVAPVLESVVAFIDGTGLDLSENRSYTGLAANVSTFTRANSNTANQFQGVITFSRNVHSLVDGANAVPELATAEFQTVVADMDTTLSVALLALMELNDSVDAYNGYHSWISARLAGAIYSLPDGYADPVPSNSRLNPNSLTQ